MSDSGMRRIMMRNDNSGANLKDYTFLEEAERHFIKNTRSGCGQDGLEMQGRKLHDGKRGYRKGITYYFYNYNLSSTSITFISSSTFVVVRLLALERPRRPN